nr:MAG TPA: hypothetical protein [Caudoviricetes sp.]
MTRLVRLNEVQYAATEEQVTALTMQGFREEALPEPALEPQESAPAPEPASESTKGRGGKGDK